MTPSNMFGEKVVVITGSTRGLGLELATRFASKGSLVVICGRQRADVESVCRTNENFVPGVCDFLDVQSKSDFVKSLQSRFERVDYLICNIGGGRPIDVEDSFENFRHFIDLNLLTTMASIETTRDLLKGSLQNPTPICVISSIAGTTSTTAPLGYSVAKAALNNLVQRLAPSLAIDGIRINSLVLGNLMYNGSTWETKVTISGEPVDSFIKRCVPLGRFGNADDVFGWCEFLGSSLSSFATGASIVVDGGQSAL